VRNIFYRINNWTNQHLVPFPIRSLLFITALSLGINTVLLIIHPPYALNEKDIWWNISLNLIHGDGYSICSHSYFPFCGPANMITASREPLPVLFFALVAFVFNDSYFAGILTEVAFNVVILWGAFFLTRKWANTKTALAAAFIWSIYPPALGLTDQISGDLLAAVFITWGLYLILRARDNDNIFHWLLAGIFLGAGVMSRSATLAIVMTLAFGFALERWFTKQKPLNKILPSAIILLASIGMMTPWVIRNSLELGKPIVGSSLVGYNIYRHNYMLGTNNYFRYVGSKEGHQALQELLARRTDLLGTENEAQMDDVYRSEGVNIIRAHPLQYAELSLFRFFPLWFNWGVNEAYGTPPDIVDYSVMAFQGTLMVLAIFVVYQTRKDLWPLWISIVAISAAYMLIDSQLRYLISVMPLVISLSAKGVVVLTQNISRHRVNVRGYSDVA